MINKETLLQSVDLIPISEIDITFDPSETIGYDLTVEDFFTFETHDGIFVQDTMAVYLPMSDEANEECKLKMMGAVTGDSSYGICFEISKEMCAGLYVLTKPVKLNKQPVHVDEKFLEETRPNIYDPVVYKNIHTTMGKAIFNNCLPHDHIFIDVLVTKKIVNNLISEIVRKYGEVIAKDVAFKLEKIGFKYATIVSPTFDIDQLEIPKEIYELKKKMVGASMEQSDILLKEMERILAIYLKSKDCGLWDLVDAGATKGLIQPFTILVAKGIVADAQGKLQKPIIGSLADGLTASEFFTASSGSRKGIMDRVLSTATTGYLSRKLAYLLNSVEVDPYLQDCKTTRTLDIKLDSDLMKRMTGRYVLVGNKVEEFDPKKFKSGQLVYLRSPIYCQSPKICHICYGKLIMRHKTPYVGVIASQCLGERATQLVMRSFHSSAVKMVERHILKDIVDNDPLIEE